VFHSDAANCDTMRTLEQLSRAAVERQEPTLCILYKTGVAAVDVATVAAVAAAVCSSRGEWWGA
jgi:hypothetical protein